MADFTESQKKYMKELFQNITTNFEQKTEDVKKTLKSEFTKFKEEINVKIKNYEDKIEQLETDNTTLKRQVLTLERKSRKNNIVIFGLNTVTPTNIIEEVLKLFKETLLVPISEQDLSHIYTIGKSAEKPIVVEFISFYKKLAVIKNCYKLKNTNIAISQDQCPEDQENTKILRKYKKEAEEKGEKATIKFNSLKIEDKVYSIRELQAKKDTNREDTQTSTNFKRNIVEVESGEETEVPEIKKNKVATKVNKEAEKSRMLRSIIPKLQDLKFLIESGGFAFFALSETWLNSTIDNEVLKIKGYDFVRCDREGRGGGIILYYKNCLKINVISHNKSNWFESIWVSVSINGLKYVVGVIYRPPGFNNFSEFLDEFDDIICKLLIECDSFFSVGDFNINCLDMTNKNVSNFLSVLESYSLKQIIEEPTRITATCSTLIDLIITSKNSNIVSSKVNNDIDLSDHSSVECSFNVLCIKNEPKFYTFRDFKNFNIEEFYVSLCRFSFNEVFNELDVNNKLTILNNILLSLFDHYAPVRTVRVTKKRAPWLTDNLRLIFRLRNKALQKFKKTKTPNNWDNYKMLRNYANKLIKNEKRAHINSVFTSNNSKQNWKILKDLNVTSKSLPEIPSNLNNEIDINNYFASIIQTEQEPDSIKYNFYNNNEITGVSSFHFSTVSENEVHKCLLSIKSKAVGSDGISIGMLLFCCPFIIPVLTHIINYCIETSSFPKGWKLSYITPIPKVRCPTELKDLRPISILPTMSKILEKLIYQQIRNHLDTFNILPPIQSGFRSRYSCTTALLKVTDDILQDLDSNNMAALILLDYSKAFDLINHKLLLAILKFIGFGYTSVIFLKMYLSDRQQCVRIKNNISTPVEIKCGVPQGSILGPLLFAIYTSQLVKCIKNCNFHLYADDTQLYFPFKCEDLCEITGIINKDLENLSLESSAHSLQINPQKSKVIVFSKRGNVPSISLTINGQKIEQVNKAKNLGVIFDSNLRFSEHVSNCVKKAFYNLKNIYSQRHLLNTNIKKLVCDSMVLSHFNYCDALYGFCLTKIDERRIQRLQNSCVRLICGVRRRLSVKSKFCEIGWLNMSERRLLHSLVLFNNVVTYKCPPYLYNKIKFRTDVHTLNIRNRLNLTIPRHKSAIFQRSYSYNIAKWYNLLPDSVFVVQHVDVCMFSNGKFKNVVAVWNAKDNFPVQSGGKFDKTFTLLPVFVVQHVDVCMFSNGKFKNVVAVWNAKDNFPVQSGGKFDKTFTLLPVKSSTKNWIALEDSYTKSGTSLASTVTTTAHNPDDRNVFAIYVSYYVKVKLLVSVMGGELSLKLPFTLMHTCSEFEHSEPIIRLERPNSIRLEDGATDRRTPSPKQDKDGT
ncbi:unnamed protein product [Brassicogethes aeneus]|uniref:Reverse transcriptase domain-containing protein n=1 Tax=Brassicogethes aeneus TaxID=1431903 RepID=A0A9P0FJL2_BRAAE|nr:unnamed protein product [Brassicogethes aeneus]